MGDWLHYLRLRAKAKTGVNRYVVISGIIVAWSGTAALLWISVTLFLWLSQVFESYMKASIILSIGYSTFFILAGTSAWLSTYYAKKRAEAQLATQKAALFDPSMITVGLEIGRAIGWRRLISLAGVVLLASGLAKEWIGRDQGLPPEEEN
jgi:hypothetical protein